MSNMDIVTVVLSLFALTISIMSLLVNLPYMEKLLAKWRAGRIFSVNYVDNRGDNYIVEQELNVTMEYYQYSDYLRIERGCFIDIIPNANIKRIEMCK